MLKALIIEDNEVDRQLYSLAFEKIKKTKGIEVSLSFITSFDDFEEQIKSTISPEFIFTIVDLNLNGMKSFPYISQLRKEFPDLYILAMSSAANEEDISSAYESGVNDFYMKPNSQANLRETLVRLISRAQNE